MRVMTFDPSAVCGYAFGDPLAENTPPISGVYKLQTGDPLTKRLVALEAWAIDRLKGGNITHVGIEEPFLPRHGDFKAVSVIVSYVMILGVAAQKCGCHCTLISNQTWRSALGLPTQGPKNVLSDPYYAEKFGKRKNALKEAKRAYVKDVTMRWVRERGSEPVDDNEGDAIAIFHAYAQSKRSKIVEPGFDFGKDLDI